MGNNIETIKKYVRATNYLAAAQIYLQDNYLLEAPLTQQAIKSRLLGHWGACPGINFVYAQVNDLIVRHQSSMLFILGGGHGFPALQANLFVEGTLGKYYPDVTQNERGIAYIAKNFSWPYGFPSHSNPGTPGVILEGGELGYALSTAYGAILDKPELIAVCMVGDGEAETGPTATAWHINKFIDPKTNGAVLPILHLNGYKISGPTIFGRMSDEELTHLFMGYGYEPMIVDGEDDVIYERMYDALERAHATIREIQRRSREGGEEIVAPRFPMIVLRTKKGWTGVKEMHGRKIEGNFASHQVVGVNAKTDQEEFALVRDWLSSYRFHELFDKENGFVDEIRALIPPPELRMGDNPIVFGGKAVTDLVLPSIEEFTEDATVPGTIGSSSMRRIGAYLNRVFILNDKSKNFRLFSPDETYSNKLDEIFKTTARPFVWKHEAWDEDMSRDGRCIEMLSEHTLQGLMQGYVLTGRHGVFASYEAFIQIVSSMVDQYAKFLKVARETEWRGDVPSLNFILTSSGWRQEHNGFSHQNPGFVSNVLHRQGCFVHVYFPPDGNSALAVMERCLTSRNEINVIVAGKTLEPRWLTPELAKKSLVQGLMTWDFASDANPDIVLAACGDYLTKEALAAISLVKRETPYVKMRFVSIVELSTLGIGNSECRIPVDFNDFFTKDKPVIFNFHGYPETLKQMMFDREHAERFSVHGYIENGSTTTPFDMHVRNGTSRYQLAQEVFTKMAERGVIERSFAQSLVQKYNQKLREHTSYIVEHGVDPDEIENWQWNA